MLSASGRVRRNVCLNFRVREVDDLVDATVNQMLARNKLGEPHDDASAVLAMLHHYPCPCIVRIKITLPTINYNVSVARFPNILELHIEHAIVILG